LTFRSSPVRSTHPDDFIYKDDRRRVELVRMIQKTLSNMGYE